MSKLTWGQLKCIAEKYGATDNITVFNINVTECKPEDIVARVFEQGLVIDSLE